MYRRKIQLIAGTTYSVSLPKEWVKINNLREKNEINISEGNDKTLILSPHALKENKLNEFSLPVDNYTSSIEQVLFVLYYLGFETITLHSKKELPKELKVKIRKTIANMSGTEISYEDKQKITIKILLDKTRIDIIQVLYRISLIIELSMTNMLEKFDIEESRMNENEIDRLYHLSTKIVSLALIDSSILQSSRINHVSLIPSYFLISKKLENIGDNINGIAEYTYAQTVKFEHKEEIMSFAKSEIGRSISHMLANFPSMFEKTPQELLQKINNLVSKVKDNIISDYLRDIIRYIVDIQEEIVNISFYNKLISDKIL